MRGSFVVGVTLAAALASCGGRTDLPVYDLEPCPTTGERRPCASICGIGEQHCREGLWQPCSAPRPGVPALVGTVRDFRASHPDFEAVIGDDRGIVEPRLGVDDKPVYASPRDTPTTSGAPNFNQWFREVRGVNESRALDLDLEQRGSDPRRHVFSDSSFFPIDDELLGNEGRSHNFHFTFELSSSFRYRGGEHFEFRGDDDVWVFIDRQLVIDLGGVHSPQRASVDVDSLGLVPGTLVPLHLFFAERHTSESNFHLDTTFTEFAICQ